MPNPETPEPAAESQDARRLDWLEAEPERLREVYWRMENEEEDLRTAIDALARLQAGEKR